MLDADHADQLAALRIAPVVTVLALAYAGHATRRRFKRQRKACGPRRSATGVTAPLVCHGTRQPVWRVKAPEASERHRLLQPRLAACPAGVLRFFEWVSDVAILPARKKSE
jgi:hypothetical protein